MAFKNLLLEQRESVTQIVINRPPYNVLNIETINEMNRALELAQKDKNKVVVIRGNGGKAFVAGVDVGDHSVEKGEEMVEAFTLLMNNLVKVGKPTIAAVEGICSGGGFEVAMYCDMIVAEEGAKFSQPEINLAVFPGPAIVFLNRKISRNRAFELIMTGEPISAEEAYRLGLVNKIAKREDFDDSLKEFCNKFTNKSLVALKYTREAIYKAYDVEFSKAFEWVDDIYTGKVMHTHDFKEGLASFLEKRKPAWEDR